MRLRREDRPGMEIRNRCSRCMCHQLPIQFGDLYEGCCSECGCAKTLEAFDRLAKPIEKTNASTKSTA